MSNSTAEQKSGGSRIIFLRPDCGRPQFFGGFSAAVNFSVAAAKFSGCGAYINQGRKRKTIKTKR